MMRKCVCVCDHTIVHGFMYVLCLRTYILPVCVCVGCGEGGGAIYVCLCVPNV